MFVRSTVHRYPLLRAGLGVLAVVLALALHATDLEAQGVSYTSVTRAEFGGSLGTILQLVPGAQDENREATYMKGLMMRTDSDDTSTIIDAETGQFTVLNHEDQTYFTYTMEEMMEMASSGMGNVEAQQMEAREARENPEASFDVKISTDRTGRTMEIGGFPAEQFVLTLELVPTSPETAAQTPEEGGSMAVVTEIWVSQEVPGWEEFRKAQAEMAQEAVGAVDGDAFAAAIQQAFATDPRMQEAFEENMEAVKEMDGIALKTVTNFVTVPAEKSLDANQVLAMADEPLGTDLGAAVGDAAKDAAKDQAADAVRNLTGGLFGRKKKEEPKEEEAPEPVQIILMRMTSAIQDLETGQLSDDLFQIPAGYSEVASPWKGAGGSR